jgi:SAM-dependent methyltransferase
MPSLCELCNPARYSEPEWLAIHRAIEAYAVDKHVFLHTNGGHVYRKGWEWTQCAYGLHQFQAITPSATAVAVGAGREPLIFYFGERIRQVVALDLYGNEAWSRTSGREANADIVGHPERWCPATMDFSRIHFVNASATEIPFLNASFDFCWSLSSIEHFGGHRAAANAMRELARVTKPGGVVAIATEFLLLSDYHHPEYFNREDLNRSILTAAADLELASAIDWTLPPSEYLIDSVPFPHAAHRLRRHVVLNDGEVQWTSILIFFRKRG